MSIPFRWFAEVYHHWFISLRWRHNGCDSVSNHQPHYCLLNRLFRRRSKETSKLRVTGLCAGNSPGTGEFSAQMASNAENVSIWWRHHVVAHRLFDASHYMNQRWHVDRACHLRVSDSEMTELQKPGDFARYQDNRTRNGQRRHTVMNIFQWKFIWNFYILIQENIFEVSSAKCWSFLLCFCVYVCLCDTKTWWWLCFRLISNLILSFQCMSWTWYIPMVFQLHIVTPIILLPLIR